ncbi:MAG: methylated-DNA--[protein]-cysteine S-methyltransferase, partial [Spirochaetota bacterium]
VRPDLLGLYRTQGIDSRRASLAGAVRLPQVSRWGDLVTASFSLRGDLYAVRGDAEAGIDDGDVRWRARLMPRATLDWRRPYARTGANGIAYGIEPVASVTAAPTGVDDPAIPNEDSLDLEFEGTEFQRLVWQRLRKINYGDVVTYGEIARKIGKKDAARAVGNAVASNPIPIVVPCHRVVPASGNIGNYALRSLNGGGAEAKRSLLALEGAL